MAKRGAEHAADATGKIPRDPPTGTPRPLAVPFVITAPPRLTLRLAPLPVVTRGG
ncbi:hypothetical protein [Amycolatopsis balhimycina]|uniref:hypothetical protein n=1 Tax=Amycolatopsis balhimycina TaxID=208443 RepID=UPI0003776B0F|nr:hypothetical protein [Amycolatopsis balhimycina]